MQHDAKARVTAVMRYGVLVGMFGLTSALVYFHSPFVFICLLGWPWVLKWWKERDPRQQRFNEVMATVPDEKKRRIFVGAVGFVWISNALVGGVAWYLVSPHGFVPALIMGAVLVLSACLVTFRLWRRFCSSTN